MNFKDVFQFRFMWDLSEFAEYLLIVLAFGASLFAYKTLVKIFEGKKRDDEWRSKKDREEVEK